MHSINPDLVETMYFFLSVILLSQNLFAGLFGDETII